MFLIATVTMTFQFSTVVLAAETVTISHAADEPVMK